jgi:DNA-binding CsgD family transcriptional regulator
MEAVTVVDIALIQKLRENGQTIAQIASQIGISRPYLSILLKRKGIFLGRINLLYQKHGYLSANQLLEVVSNCYNQKLTILEISKRLKINYRSLSAFLYRNNFKTRDNSDAIAVRSKDVQLTEIEKSIINGLLLGDGHIELRSKARKHHTAFLVYTCKYKSVLDSLAKDLHRFNAKVYRKIYRYKGMIRRGYRLITHSYKLFLQFRREWYRKSIKRVPNDIQLTSLTCYWWYLGDGSSNSGIFLFTNSFSVKDVLRLIRIAPVPFKLIFRKNYHKGSSYGKKYPIMVIYNKGDRVRFLTYIGDCRHPVYSYKWRIYRSDHKEINF